MRRRFGEKDAGDRLMQGVAKLRSPRGFFPSSPDQKITVDSPSYDQNPPLISNLVKRKATVEYEPKLACAWRSLRQRGKWGLSLEEAFWRKRCGRQANARGRRAQIPPQIFPFVCRSELLSAAASIVLGHKILPIPGDLFRALWRTKIARDRQAFV